LVTLDIQIATLFRSPTDTPKDRAAASPRAKTEPDLADGIFGGHSSPLKPRKYACFNDEKPIKIRTGHAAGIELNGYSLDR
jgi:hypothetical protein